jgi:glycosyltransferase involved in cell wall biosynthesis
MNLLVLSKNPGLPSFRQRIKLYFDMLRENGIEYKVVKLPHGSLTRRKVYKLALDYDGVFLHKRNLKFFDALWLRFYARKIIYDFDDAIMFDDKNPEIINYKRQKAFQRTVKLADLVITGNKYLAEHAKKFNHNVKILLTGLDTKAYDPNAASSNDDKIRLVWIGGKDTLKYLAKIKPILEQIGKRFDNVTLRIICNDFFDLENMKVEKCQWSLQNQAMDLASCDIGLAPLIYDHYTRGKCGFKILQYAAAGLPTVASPVGVNSEYVLDGVTGYHIHQEQQWLDKISQLIEHPDQRKQMGKAARKMVKDFDVSILGRKFINLITESIEKKTSNNRTKKRPRKFILKLYNRVDKLKFSLKIKPKSDLIIISGADSSHFKSLVQFIKSAEYYEYHSKLVIYDLGLTKENSDFIKTNFPKVDLRIFDYSKYPSYFDIKKDAGKFAWKPVIIYEVLNYYRKSVIWCDAGCVITQPLYRIRSIINTHGYYSPIAQGAIGEWIPKVTAEFLNADEDILNKRILAGGVVALNFNNPKAMNIIRQWRKCVLEENCSAPEGSNKKLHRYQSILSVLAYRSGIPEKIPQRVLGFKIHQDVD